MSDKPISQMTKKEINDFLTKHFGNLRKAKKQLENFESEILKLKANAKEAIREEALTISRSIKAEKRSVNDKAKDTRKLAITNQGLINTELQNTKDLAENTKLLVDERLNKANALLLKIEQYHNNLLNDITDKDGKVTKSIKTKNSEYNKEQRKEFSQLRKDFEKEIRDLLPEAGAASLSSSYFKAKARYGAVPYKQLTDEEKADKTKPRGPNAFWHFIGTNIKGVMFYILFIAPLVVIIILMLRGDVVGLGDLIIDKKLSPNALLSRFFISSPFALISWFGWGSIRLNRRLYEEYNHKQRVMELYHSFNREFKGDKGIEQKQKLLDIMLQNVADKPSLAVHSGKGQIEQISFLKGMFVITRRTTKQLETESSTGKNNSGTDKGNK